MRDQNLSGSEPPVSQRPVSERPMPVPDELSAPFWAAIARHEVRLQCCVDCADLRHPPRVRCPACYSRRPADWVLIEGPWCLRTWTTVHLDVLPGTSAPFTVGEAGLVGQDAVVVIALVDGPAEGELRRNQELTVAFDDLRSPDGEDFTLLRLVGEARS